MDCNGSAEPDCATDGDVVTWQVHVSTAGMSNASYHVSQVAIETTVAAIASCRWTTAQLYGAHHDVVMHVYAQDALPIIVNLYSCSPYSGRLHRYGPIRYMIQITCPSTIVSRQSPFFGATSRSPYITVEQTPSMATGQLQKTSTTL